MNHREKEHVEEHVVDEPAKNTISRNDVHPRPYISDHFSFVATKGGSFFMLCRLCPTRQPLRHTKIQRLICVSMLKKATFPFHC